MTRRYTSFLLRWWHLDDHQQRIKIEHVQSGEGVQVAKLADALAWLEAHFNNRDPAEVESTQDDGVGDRASDS